MRKNQIPYIPPRRLLFSGGGIRVISYLGVLQILQERKLLGHIREFCGVSAGALVSLMLALGYSMQIIERFCYEYDFSNVRSLEPDNAFELLDKFGLDSGENLEKLIEKILYHRGFLPNTNFEDLHISGRVKSLRMWAADIQNLKPIEFSYLATPKITIIDAMRASMAIPLYFTPVRHPQTQTLLCDGGVFDNYPISYLTDGEAEESLGVCFEFGKLPVDIQDVSAFLSMITSGYYMPSYRKLIEKHRLRTIVIPCAEYSCLDFEISKENRHLLVTKGRQAAEDFFSRSFEVYSTRRHSVS
jgi:NTE family protein